MTDANGMDRIFELDGYIYRESDFAFLMGAMCMREMLARFVEQGGDPTTATSIRLNWNPTWCPEPPFNPEQYAFLMSSAVGSKT